MRNKLQRIELTIKDIEDGIFAVSLVQNPAIELPFVALSSEEISLKVIDEEKQIVVGYALIPEKVIPRRHKEKMFEVTFSAETVRYAAEMYMKQLNLNNVTVEHKKKVSDIGIIESWITEDVKHDKINLYGLEPVIGGWAIIMKVDNKEEWTKVKSGEYLGFSIEGKFSGFEQLLSEQTKTLEFDGIKNEIIEIIKQGLSE